jgi:hypothetical protein
MAGGWKGNGGPPCRAASCRVDAMVTADPDVATTSIDMSAQALPNTALEPTRGEDVSAAAQRESLGGRRFVSRSRPGGGSETEKRTADGLAHQASPKRASIGVPDRP